MKETAMVAEELKNIENDLETLFLRLKNINKRFNHLVNHELSGLKPVVYISRAEAARLLEVPETKIEELERSLRLSVPQQRAGKNDRYLPTEVINLWNQKNCVM